MKLHWKLRKTFKKKPAAALFHNHAVDGVEASSNAAQKRADMQQPGQYQKRRQDPVPVNGQTLPSEEDGWVSTRPVADSDFVVCGVRKILMTDGSSLLLFRVKLTAAAQAAAQAAEAERQHKIEEQMKELQRKVKKLQRQAKRQAEEAEAKLAKQRVKLTLALLGKRLR